MSETKDNMAALAADVESALERKRSKSAAAISWIREAALLPVMAVLIVVGALLNPHFLTVSNLTGIGQQISSLGVVVVGESLILLIGGMDLSLEATYGLAPMIAAWLIVPAAAFGNGMELNPYLGILILLAVGGNRAAARAAGIKVNKVRMGVYVAGSILAAIGGWMEAGRVSSVAPTQGYGEGIIFAVFAAAVIGGVSLQGGRGNMVGAAPGLILLGVVQNILDLENAPNYWIDAIDGAVILLALNLARVIGGEASAE